MTWFAGWILDHTPWWLWALVAAGILAATYQLWLPIWLRLPAPLRTTVIGGAAAALAYLAGRNKGSAGAVQRERDRQQAATDRLIKDKQEKDDAAARLSDDALDRDNARWLRK